MSSKPQIKQRAYPSKWGDADLNDRVNLARSYSETMNYLNRLSRAIAEGGESKVDEASNFARWLNFSGLINIFRAHPQEFPVEVDGAKAQALVDELVAACGQIYKGGKIKPNPHVSKIDALEAKVDILLSHVAKNVTPSKNTPVLVENRT